MIRCISALEQTRAGRIALVLVLTVLWWACAVYVTVAIKDALGGEVMVGEENTGPFPYPLTLTLWANIGTAIATGIVAIALRGYGAYFGDVADGSVGSSDASRSQVLHAAPRESPYEDEAAGQQADGVDAEAEGKVHNRQPELGGFFNWGRWYRHSAIVPAEHDGGHDSAEEPQEGPSSSSAGFEGNSGRSTGQQASFGSSVWQLLKSALGGMRGHIVLIGLLQGLGMGVMNETLKFLTVSTRTMLMATNVLAVMLMAGLFGLESLEKSKIVSALLLGLGSMLQGVTTWEGFQKKDEDKTTNADDPLGYALAILALLLDALRWVLLQAVFVTQEKVSSSPSSSTASSDPSASSAARSEGGSKQPSGHYAAAPKFSKFAMVSWVMWNSTPWVLGLSIVFEPAGLQQAALRPLALVCIISPLTLGVIGINVAEFGVVQWTSAVTFNVLSQLHSIPMVLAGVVWFGEDVALVQILGFSVCLLGAVLYSFARAGEQPQSAEERGGAGR